MKYRYLVVSREKRKEDEEDLIYAYTLLFLSLVHVVYVMVMEELERNECVYKAHLLGATQLVHFLLHQETKLKNWE